MSLTAMSTAQTKHLSGSQLHSLDLCVVHVPNPRTGVAQSSHSGNIIMDKPPESQPECPRPYSSSYYTQNQS